VPHRIDELNLLPYDIDIDTPPFEVTEKGWGEFQIIIRIHFIDLAGLPPVQLTHSLK
jgi:YEATS domain-containing protein 4